MIEIQWKGACGCGSEDGRGRYTAEVQTSNCWLELRTSLVEDDDDYLVRRWALDKITPLDAEFKSMTLAELETLLQ